MSEQTEKMTIKDAENAARGILSLVMKYPDYPKEFKADNTTVKWNSINAERSIGVFPLQGAVYLRKYVSGSYVAQLPFQLAYKCSPTTNKATIEAQELLSNLSRWMEDCGMSFKDSHLTFESLNRTSLVYGYHRDEKIVGYAVNMQLKFVYKK